MVASLDVRVKWQTPRITAASVRDAAGVHDVRRDVRRDLYRGWRCSCSSEGCAHVEAVRRFTEASPRSDVARIASGVSR